MQIRTKSNWINICTWYTGNSLQDLKQGYTKHFLFKIGRLGISFSWSVKL